MQAIIDWVGGLWELLRLGALSRFRFRGAYWTWRLYTAFGKGYPANRSELVRGILAYGRWMYRVRRGR